MREEMERIRDMYARVDLRIPPGAKTEKSVAELIVEGIERR